MIGLSRLKIALLVGSANSVILGVDPAVARLRVIASSGGQYAAHPTPPTMTAGALNGATAVPSSAGHANGSMAKFRYLGGDWAAAGTAYPDTVYWTVGAYTVTVGSVRGGVFGAIETQTNARYFEPAFQANGQLWRLIADGLDCGILPSLSGSSSLYRVLVDFGSAASRTIRLEHVGGTGSPKIWEIRTESAASLTATSAAPAKLILFGDSFFSQTGAANLTEALVYKMALQLGFRDFHVSAIGGTGWVQDGPSPFFAVDGATRWPLDVTAYSPDMVVVMMGGNDMGDGNDAAVQAACAQALTDLAAAKPDCLIHVFSPWDKNAPSAPEAGFAGISAALSGAVAGKGRVWFHSLQGVEYTKADGVHPDTAGHTTLYKAMFNKIAAVSGIAAVV